MRLDRVLYVVEIFTTKYGFTPLGIASISKRDAIGEMQERRMDDPVGKYRVAKYIPAPEKTVGRKPNALKSSAKPAVKTAAKKK